MQISALLRQSRRASGRRSEPPGPLTVASEHVDVELLEQVHDEGVDLRQQPHEEDEGEAQGEDCRGGAESEAQSHILLLKA